jgi:hypothetical protein
MRNTQRKDRHVPGRALMLDQPVTHDGIVRLSPWFVAGTLQFRVLPAPPACATPDRD